MNKNIIFPLALATASLLASTPSFALVRELAQCETKDGRYEISIMDNQGTGFERKPNPVAAIRDARSGQVVESYSVMFRQGHTSGFSGRHWMDTDTAGRRFDLVGAINGDHGYSISAELPAGKSLENERVSCSVFAAELDE